MRAFLAVIPPEEVIEQIVTFLEPRQDALAALGDWRWTRPEHLHLTLAFLPELEEWREEELIDAGTAWAERARPLHLRLAGAGAFPDPGAARVLWAAVRAEPDELGRWASGLRAVSSRSGARVQGTRFVAHLTLARSRGGPRPAGHLVQALDTLVTDNWVADEVALVRSHLGQGPRRTPRYEVRHTWTVGGR